MRFTFNANPMLAILRNCAVCGAAWPPKKWLCRDCEEILKVLLLEPEVMRWEEIKSLEIYTLLDWHRGAEETVFLSRLMYSLKGGARQEAWDHFALKFLTQWNQLAAHKVGIQEQVYFKPILFVPAPPRHFGEMDHAGHFAQSLAERLEAPVYWGLRRKQTRRSWVQKHMGRSQRARLEIEHQGKRPSYLTKDWTVIFVDDLITTGATARAVARTFKEYECQFMVWTLARRSLSEDD